MTIEQVKALRQIGAAIIESVEASGHTGAPGGVLYAALMAHGCSLNQFDGIMGGLVKAGFLRKEGECFFSTGREFTPAVNAPAPAAVASSPRGWDSVGGVA